MTVRSSRRRLPRLRIGAAIVGVVVCVACAEPPPKGPPRTIVSHPHAADRYARLLERQLVDADPVAIEQAILCEQNRMADALGTTETILRSSATLDSVHYDPAKRARRNRIDAALQGHGFVGDGPKCEALRAEADREVPLVPADTSIRNH